MTAVTILKKLSVGVVSVLLLTGCASLADTKVTIHDEDKIDASVTIAYDKSETGSNDSWKQALDDATKDKPEETKVEPYETDTMIGRTYTIKDKSLAEQQKWILSSMKGGQITKKDGKFQGVFYFDSRSISAKQAYFSVTTPGKMESAPNATIDGNTATWDLNQHYEKLEFEGQDKSNTGIVVGIVIVSLLGGAVAYFLSRRRNPIVTSPSTES